MGACGSTATTPAMIDRRRRDLATLKAWRKLLASMPDQDRHMKMAKGHECCAALTWCVFRTSRDVDASFDCLNRINAEEDDWMVLMAPCGVPLYLSSLCYGPVAHGMCPKKTACKFTEDNVKRNFDDQNLAQKLPATTRLALEIIEFYHPDLLASVLKRNPEELEKSHWVIQPRWCRGCRDAHGTLEGEEQLLAEDGLLAENQLRVGHTPSTKTRGAAGPVRIDSNGNPIRETSGQRRHSIKHSARSLAATVPIAHGHHHSLSPSPDPSRPASRPGSRAGSRPTSRAGSRKGSRENSPERSKGGVRSPPSQHHHLAHSTSMPHGHHPVGLQRLSNYGSGAHALPMLPVHSPSFPQRALSPNGIQLEWGSNGSSARSPVPHVHGSPVSGRRSPMAARAESAGGASTRTEWTTGTFVVTSFGSSELNAAGIITRITNEDGEPDAKGDWLQVRNNTNHAVVFSAPNVGTESKLTPGSTHEYQLQPQPPEEPQNEAIIPGKAKTVTMTCKYAVTHEID